MFLTDANHSNYGEQCPRCHRGILYQPLQAVLDNRRAHGVANCDGGLWECDQCPFTMPIAAAKEKV